MDFSHHFIDVVTQFREAFFGESADKNAGTFFLCYPAVFQFVKSTVFLGWRGERKLVVFLVSVGVNFIENDVNWFVAGAYFAERSFHHFHLFFEAWMRDVDDVYEYVGFPHFVEGTLECFDELGGKFADESDRVAQQEWNVLDDYLSDGGVEGCEEFVFGENVRFRKQVHKGTLANVSVADKSESYHLSTVPALGAHLPVHLGELFFETGDSLLYNSAVSFYLGFAHTAAGTSSSPLPFEVGPHAGQARKHVIVFGQLHLHLGIGSLGPLGEDFQDEAGAVDYYAVLQEPLYVTLLHAGEFVIEDAVTYVVGFAVFADFLDLTTSYIGGAVWAVDLLDEGFVALYSGGFCQEA